MGKGLSHAALVTLICVGGLFWYMTEPEIQRFAFFDLVPLLYSRNHSSPQVTSRAARNSRAMGEMSFTLYSRIALSPAKGSASVETGMSVQAQCVSGLYLRIDIHHTQRDSCVAPGDQRPSLIDLDYQGIC